MMKKTVMAAAAALCILALGACSDDHDGSPDTGAATHDPVAASAAATAGASASAAASKAAALDKPPAPSQAQAEAYVSRLREIDPEIVTGSTSAALVDRGRQQCETIYSSNSPDEQNATANTRFVTDKHPDGFGATKAAMINAAVKKYICPVAWN